MDVMLPSLGTYSLFMVVQPLRGRRVCLLGAEAMLMVRGGWVVEEWA